MGSTIWHYLMLLALALGLVTIAKWVYDKVA